tara:strand:+ start:66 stop:590 length:525 start_codon:yes stop_codon:yes gene_type:complete
MFIQNKYLSVYNAIIERGKTRVKVPNDGLCTHHIIPRSLGGSDDPDNLTVLTFKEHSLCHHLLIYFTEGINRQKMSYAYSWFGSSAGTYKTGKDNNFAQPEIIALVRERMTNNNPMKQPHQRKRMRLSNHKNKSIVTPAGKFISRAAALRHHKFKHWKVLYDLMDKHPDQYYWD